MAVWNNDQEKEQNRVLFRLLEQEVHLFEAQLFQHYQRSIEEESASSCPCADENNETQVLQRFLRKLKSWRCAIYGTRNTSAHQKFHADEQYFLIMNVPKHIWKHLMRLLQFSEEEIEQYTAEDVGDDIQRRYDLLQLWLVRKENIEKNKLIEDIYYALSVLKCVRLAEAFRFMCSSHERGRSAPAAFSEYVNSTQEGLE